ncbi:hypothetical protein D3C83_185310 [compost metagenome]
MTVRAIGWAVASVIFRAGASTTGLEPPFCWAAIMANRLGEPPRMALVLAELAELKS